MGGTNLGPGKYAGENFDVHSESLGCDRCHKNNCHLLVYVALLFFLANARVDLRHFYEPVSFWLDDRLTREFTYLYMSSRDSIFIKIVQFTQGFYCEGPSSWLFRALIISKNFLVGKLSFILSSFKNHILLSLLSCGLSIERVKIFQLFFLPLNITISSPFWSLPKHTWMNKFSMKTLSNGKMVYVIDIVSFAFYYHESQMKFCNGIILYGCTNNHNYASYLQLSSCHILLPRQFFFTTIHRPRVRYIFCSAGDTSLSLDYSNVAQNLWHLKLRGS